MRLAPTFSMFVVFSSYFIVWFQCFYSFIHAGRAQGRIYFNANKGFDPWPMSSIELMWRRSYYKGYWNQCRRNKTRTLPRNFQPWSNYVDNTELVPNIPEAGLRTFRPRQILYVWRTIMNEMAILQLLAHCTQDEIWTHNWSVICISRPSGNFQIFFFFFFCIFILLLGLPTSRDRWGFCS